MMHIYEIDTQIELSVTFLNVSPGVPTVPADPSATSLFIIDPSGNQTEVNYPGQITRTGVGLYNYVFVPSGPGTWTYKWQGTGQVIATSRDTNFFVRGTAVLELNPP